MPQLVRLYIVNVLIGFGIAIAFVAALVALDVGGLWHLVLETDMGWLGGLMLVMFNGVVFAGVQFAIAVMRMADPEDGTPPGGRAKRPLRPVRAELVPVLVQAPARGKSRR
ncbi:hypothetical protein LAZ40_14530 [Cereibacter sphaeroides]|uniref:hypothetical protein n=1 Tax=Rhodobacterales TaxID=204455 RepID=UPI000BBEA225|nr:MULTISPECIES: hypothetical protein [Paracoccaceae]MCE6951702.1 hypothetical protein [Cereibacter sphaeroides]MCE6960241.1 hypothetical protein [Cereibacter sphaeroides]MCE6969199.1 hypothetical protein [Cereibacter sphaeroides]MCE6974852.1 hypothetical protein [Cereibacter sphaeroides]